MAHPNEDLVRKGYQAFGTGDLDTLTQLFTDDIQWHTPGRSPLAGDLKGRDEVFAQFAKIAELSGGSFRLEIHDVIANDEHAIALVTASGSREGKSLDGQPGARVPRQRRQGHRVLGARERPVRGRRVLELSVSGP